MEEAADLESHLVESISSAKTIKQFNVEDYFGLRVESRFIGFLNTVYRSGMNSIFSAESSFVINFTFTILLLWVGSYLVLSNEITVGTLFSFYAIIGYFTSPISDLIQANKTVQNALIAADRLFEIIDLEREDTEGKVEFTRGMVGDIKISNISFSYGTRTDVFDDFSLTIPKGKITAIIGESGSGKTTIAALLQKLYPIKDGKILIGNQNIDYYNNSSLRSVVSAVPQQLDIFSGNIIENIALGDLSPDMEHIVDICTDLGIMPFIEKLPAGFNTFLGEHGIGLSGGEKQRIAIARALYRKPEILILDEATSSLDSQSEHFVQQTIQKFKGLGKTVIIIAHRLSTVMSADNIVVLEHGKLLEEGTHKELYRDGTRYFEMWQKQRPMMDV
jgi:ATP-binding cassette, subfamily C, bacteriocin exporter